MSGRAEHEGGDGPSGRNGKPDDARNGDYDRDSASRRGLRRLLVDLSPLTASPAFAKLWAGNSVAQIGAQVTVVTVGLHVYDLTRSTLAVSLVALWALGPMILSGFIGGALADSFDRRRVSIITALVAWVAVGAMTLIAFLGVEEVWPYYALAALNAAAATVLGATRGAIIPSLVPAQLLPAAAALHGITMGLAVTVGPAVAGVLVAAVGFSWTYLLDVVLFSAAFMGILSLPALRPEGGRRNLGLGSVMESLRFLRRAPNVRATFVWDLIAMIFGTPRAVFPAAGMLVLGGGPVTVGILTAAYACGALLSSLVSGPLGAVRRQARAVTLAIAVYGSFIALFGAVLLVTGALQHGIAPAEPRILAIALGAIALTGAGAADNVSAIFRGTILQAAVPDDVRGRMQGLFTVVVAGGPRLGDLFSGVLATLLALWAPALLGGLVIATVMLVLLRTARGFQNYDALDPRP